MITIYANWTGNALVCGFTLDAARAKLTSTDCAEDTVFGDDVADMTALDTGSHPINHVGTLHIARRSFPQVQASGLARIV